jgi:hypothetical protein
MPLPEPQPYTHIRLIEDKERGDRYEVRVSTFIEFDDNPGRRAVTGKPTKERALEIAKEIGRQRRAAIPHQ